MTNQEHLNLMLGRLGGRSSATMRNIVLMELNNMIRELERGDVKPWFLEEIAEGTTTASQDYIELPENFLEEVEDSVVELQNSEGVWTELTKVSRGKLKEETANELPAIPEGYAIWGSRFLLGPTPDAEYNYRFPYYGRTEEVEDNTAEATNPWLIEFFNYVACETLIIVAGQHLQSSEVLQKISAGRSRLYDQFLKAVTQRDIARRTLLLTDEE